MTWDGGSKLASGNIRILAHLIAVLMMGAATRLDKNLARL
jgi:hypothetical protein